MPTKPRFLGWFSAKTPLGVKEWTRHSAALGSFFARMREKLTLSSTEHTVAAGRWDKRRCVSIAQRMQGCTNPQCRLAPAIFGKNHDICVVTLQRIGDSRQPGSAALSDIPSEQPHCAHFSRC